MHFTGTYIPRKEVAVVETIKATVIRENQAIRLRARKEGVDRGGVRRVTGGEFNSTLKNRVYKEKYRQRFMYTKLNFAYQRT